MRKLIIIGFFSSMIISCNQTPVNKKMTLDYEYNNLKSSILDTLKVRKDSVMLGFMFGWSDSQLNNHIDSLKKIGKIRDKESVNIPVGDKNYVVSGFGYDFYLGDKKHNSLITPTIEDNKLVKLELLIYSDVDNIMEQIFITLYNQKYGEYVRQNPNSGSEVYFWIKQNLEISAEYFFIQNFMMVTYKDLIYEREVTIKEQNKRRINDSLNKLESNKTIKDI